MAKEEATDRGRPRTYPTIVLAAIVVIASGLLLAGALALGLRFSSRRSVGLYATQLSTVASVGGHVLLLMIALGVVTMAALETVKRLLPVRGYFHKRELERHLGKEGFTALIQGVGLSITNLAWFDTPTEQLFAQISVLADQHIASLVRSEEASQESESGIPPGMWLRVAESKIFLASLLGLKVVNIWTYKDGQRALIQERVPAAVAIPLPEPLEYLRSQIDITLDRVQVVVSSKWRRILRLASCLTAAFFALVALAYSPAGFGVGLTTVFGAFAVGGFFAWFSRDITAGIERWRR